jgi:hypothetical protein
MPTGRQTRYATGDQYQWSHRLSIGGEFVYADYGKAKIDNDLLKGDYKRNDILFFFLERQLEIVANSFALWLSAFVAEQLRI